MREIAFKNTYCHQLYPMVDESKWSLLGHDNLQPPLIIRLAGQPKIKKKKESSEAKSFKSSF